MTMDRDELLRYLDDYLEVGNFDDMAPNGLQIEGRPEIQKIVGGVSISERLVKEAIQREADAVLVHHGLFWKRDPHPYRITGIRKRRISLLLKADMNLIAYHLPLDAHPEVGNNIQILKGLNIPALEAMEIGYVGYARKYLELEDLVIRLNDLLDTEAQVFAFGKEHVEKILVVSGSSSAACEKAAELGIDTFIGGDMREEQVRICEELGLNFIAAGHYNSEKLGVQALLTHIQEKFGIQTEFVDIPNPV